MKLKLPDVTLVMIETREHELARMAIEDCLCVADFGDVLILTDKFFPLPLPRTSTLRQHLVPDWPTKEGWARAMWFDVPPLLRTSHMLAIQWDSWIWDAAMWRDEFLRYDYVGAPWWYKDGKNVGNSGFCLKSARLARYVRDNRLKFPCDTSAEDDLLCRKYRPQLEEAGFTWAPESVARDFSFEGCDGSKPTKHFGFHAMFNWPHVLDHDRLLERAAVALNSPYIRDSYIAKAFCEKNPDIVQELITLSIKETSHGRA